MSYGSRQGETSHGDMRMLVPADAKTLADRITAANRPLARHGDVVLLEWPTVESGYTTRLSFLDREMELFRRAIGLFNDARDTGTTIGKGLLASAKFLTSLVKSFLLK